MNTNLVQTTLGKIDVRLPDKLCKRPPLIVI
jgi:hypothetical protein